MSAPQQCNGCRFWKADEDTADPNDSDWGFGDCRRLPPVIIDSLIAAEIIPPRYGQQTDLEIGITSVNVASRYPATFATDWCGQFEVAA